MALDNDAADQALDIWLASLTPPPANTETMRDAMRPLVRAIYAGIVANAEVVVKVPLDGTGAIK